MAYVLDGPRRATDSALWAYEHDGDPLPCSGEYSAVTDGSGVASCVIRVTEVEVVASCDVDAAFAFDEGEGGCEGEGEGERSLEYWCDAYRSFLSRELAGMGFTASEEIPVVCKRFEVVYPPSMPEPGDPLDLAFTYRVRKNGDVELLHRGRSAAEVVSSVSQPTIPKAQQLMAQFTGNRMHGNERDARLHPGNRGV